MKIARFRSGIAEIGYDWEAIAVQPTGAAIDTGSHRGDQNAFAFAGKQVSRLHTPKNIDLKVMLCLSLRIAENPEIRFRKSWYSKALYHL